MSRVFANGPGDQGSTPGRFLPKTQKMVFDAALIRSQHYRVKWRNPGNGEAPSLTPWCSSYWKGSFWVTIDYGCQLYFLLLKQSFLKNNLFTMTLKISWEQLKDK